MTERARDLAWLITPEKGRPFLNDVYEHHPHFIARNDAGHFRGLFDLDDLERYLATAQPWRDRSLRLTKVGAAPSEVPASTTLRGIQEATTNGFSLVLNGVQDRWQPIATLTNTLGQDLHARVLANVYFTPPGSKAFDTHIDAHDVFVLQTHGSKRWRLFEKTVRLPLDDLSTALRSTLLVDHYSPSDETGSNEDWGAVQQEFSLHQGDLLYLPRGFAHCADTDGSGGSLHVTLGLFPLRWHAFFRELVDLIASRSEGLRRALPIEILDGTRCIDSPKELLEKLAKSASQLSQEDVSQLVRVLDPAGCRELLAFSLAPRNLDDQLTLNSTIVASRGTGLSWGRRGNQLWIRCGSSFSTAPAELEPAIAFLSNKVRFRVRELPNVLSDASKVELVRRFIEEGSLSRVAGGEAAAKSD